MNPSPGVAISFLKRASASEAVGSGVGKAIKGTIRGVGKGALAILHTGGKAGRGVAKGLGANEEAGSAIGTALTGVGGLAAAKGLSTEGKNRVDNFRVRHGLYPTPGVGYY